MAEEGKKNKKDETKRKKNNVEEAPSPASDPRATVASRGGHSGRWRYHTDDCRCMMAGDGYCNRDGYVWGCCGALAKESTCAGPGRKHHTAVSSWSGDKACHCQECVNTQDQP